MKSSPLFLVAAVVLLTAGAAQAQSTPGFDLRLPDAARTAVPAAPVAKPAGVPDRAIPDLADPLDPTGPTKLQVNGLDSAVFAKTAVDHRFAGRTDVTGSLGFLCGRQPGQTEDGGAAAFGSDPHGRFVGAKLSFAF